MGVANIFHPFVSQILISLMMSLVSPFFLLLFHFRYTNLSNFPFLCDSFLCFFLLKKYLPFPSVINFPFCLQVFVNFYIWLCSHKIHLELILSYKGRIYGDILPFPPPPPKIRPLSLGEGVKAQDGSSLGHPLGPLPIFSEDREGSASGGPQGVRSMLAGLSPPGDHEVHVVADQATERSGARHSSAGMPATVLPMFIYFWNALPSKSDQVGCKALLW